METIDDFEDLLDLLDKHRVRHLIIGGLAFIYHAKPRYTKDMDLWVDPHPDNVKLANEALAEFGSPFLLNAGKTGEILQLGLAPNRIDIMLHTAGSTFETAWNKRVQGRYGRASVNWVDLDTLIQIKREIDNPRHQEDVRVLLEVKKRRERLEK